MALSDLFNFFTSDAKEKYNEKSVSKDTIRKPLLTGIKRARDDFSAEKYTKPNRWFSVKNEVVAFHPKLGGRTLTINGVDENHMPSGRFIEFLDLMEKEVEAGEFDEVIGAHGKGNVDVHIGKAADAVSTRGKRTFSEASSLTIGVAAKRRAKSPPSFEDIRQSYIDQGANAELLDKAIEKRKDAEKAAKKA